MPIYYFDTYDGQRATYDEYGAELPNLEEAADEAAALLSAFAKETLPDRQSHSFGAAVRDESDTVVYRAMLLFQGQKTECGDRSGVPAVADARRQRDRRAELKAETKHLSERLAQNVEGLLATFEELRALVEASHETLASCRPTGIS